MKAFLLLLMVGCSGTDNDPLPEGERDIIYCVQPPSGSATPCERACVDGLDGPLDSMSCVATHPKTDDEYGCGQTFETSGTRGCCVIYKIPGDTVNVYRFFACGR